MLDDRMVTTDEAGQYLGVSRQCLNVWRMSGKGPRYFKQGRVIRYRLSDLAAWVERHMKGEAAHA